jgi:hypothetical protein
MTMCDCWMRLKKTPSSFGIAEFVGKWVCIQYAEIQQQLAQLGIHWNNTRKSWQHPSGTIAHARANHDPRKR